MRRQTLIILLASAALLQTLARSGVIQDHEIPTPALDPNFAPANNPCCSTIHSILTLPNGRILACGAIGLASGRSPLVLFGPDGSLAGGFQANVGIAGDLEAKAVALQSDGKILVAGIRAPNIGTHRIVFFSRLNADGTLDRHAIASADSATASVHSMIIQPDEKLLLGGDFVVVNGFRQAGLVRIRDDGTTDTEFNLGRGLRVAVPGRNDSEGTVRALALQSDGKILVSGVFNRVHDLETTGLARLNPDGSPDYGFRPVPFEYGGVLAVGQDGKIYAASREVVHCLNPDGSEDALFNISSVINLSLSEITAMAERVGQLWISAWSIDSREDPMHRVFALNPDASTVSNSEVTFQQGGVDAITFDSTGGIVVGGTFSGVNGVARSSLARLLPDAAAKPAFQFSAPTLEIGEDQGTAALTILRTGNSSDVASVEYLTSSETAEAGFVSQGATLQFAPGETRKSISIPMVDDRLVTSNRQFTVTLRNPSGTTMLGAGPMSQTVTIHDAERPGAVDFRFDPAVGGHVISMAVQPDGKVLAIVAGNVIHPATELPTCLFRLNQDGSFDPSFRTAINYVFWDEFGGLLSGIQALALQPDGKAIVGGVRNPSRGRAPLAGETVIPGVGRLNSDGTTDQTFDVGTGITNGVVQAITVQTNGHVLVAGTFTSVNGVTRNGLARLTARGQVDPSFDSGLGFGEEPDARIAWSIRSLVLQPDGKVLVGGSFTNFQGAARSGIVRLQADGSLDTSFNPGYGLRQPFQNSRAYVGSIIVQANGQILVGGWFRSFDHVARPGIARLNPDGSLDQNFPSDLLVADLNVPVLISTQGDGRILVANNPSFSSRNPAVRRLTVARLTPEGAVDPTFDAGFGFTDERFCRGRTIKTLVPLPNGELLVDGSFSWFDQVPRPGLVRLHADPPLRLARIQTRNGIGSQLTLSVLPERATVLESSSDLRSWTSLRTNAVKGFTQEVTDTEAVHFPQRFYRLRQAEP